VDYIVHSVYACWQLLCVWVSVTIINYFENCIKHGTKAMHKQKHINRITFACAITTTLSITFSSTNNRKIPYIPDYPTSTYTTFCLIQHGHMMYCAQFHAIYVHTYAFNQFTIHCLVYLNKI